VFKYDVKNECRRVHRSCSPELSGRAVMLSGVEAGVETHPFYSAPSLAYFARVAWLRRPKSYEASATLPRGENIRIWKKIINIVYLLWGRAFIPICQVERSRDPVEVESRPRPRVGEWMRNDFYHFLNPGQQLALVLPPKNNLLRIALWTKNIRIWPYCND